MVKGQKVSKKKDIKELISGDDAKRGVSETAAFCKVQHSSKAFEKNRAFLELADVHKSHKSQSVGTFRTEIIRNIIQKDSGQYFVNMRGSALERDLFIAVAIRSIIEKICWKARLNKLPQYQ